MTSNKQRPKASLFNQTKGSRLDIKALKLLSKVNIKKKPGSSIQLEDDDLEYLVYKLAPVLIINHQAQRSLSNFRKKYPDQWRTLMNGVVISEALRRKFTQLDYEWPDWKKEFENQSFLKFLEEIRAGDGLPEIIIDRNKRSIFFNLAFDWLAPHTQLEYARATGLHRRTIEKILKRIKAQPIIPARGRKGAVYSPEIGLKVFKVWVTTDEYLTKVALKRKFRSYIEDEENRISSSKDDLRAKLGAEFLKKLNLFQEDEKLKRRFKKVILEILPGSDDRLKFDEDKRRRDGKIHYVSRAVNRLPS